MTFPLAVDVADLTGNRIMDYTDAGTAPRVVIQAYLDAGRDPQDLYDSLRRAHDRDLNSACWTDDMESTYFTLYTTLNELTGKNYWVPPIGERG